MVLRTPDCRLLAESTQSRLFYSVAIPPAATLGGVFTMDILYPCCAGLDVHKEKVVACLRKLTGGSVRQEVRTFRTETNALLEMADWLAEAGVTHVALESTGVYWKPIWNLFEGIFEMLLVNAEHLEKSPGPGPTSRTASGSPSCCSTSSQRRQVRSHRTTNGSSGGCYGAWRNWG